MAKRADGEGTIYRRSDGRFEAKLRYTDPITGKAMRRAVYGKTQAEARAKLREAKSRIAAGAPVKDSKIMLGAYAEQWIGSTLAASNRKASTKELYAILTRRHVINGVLADMQLDKIRPSDVERFILDRQGRLSPSSVRQVYTILRAVLDAAVRDGLIASNVAAKVQRPGVPRREAEWLTPAQLETLLTVRGVEDRYSVLFRIYATTGLRRGEALALRWQDVDLTGGSLRVTRTLGRVNGRLDVSEPKWSSRRTVPLLAPIVAMLRDHRTRQLEERLAAGSMWQDHDLVFATSTGHYLDPRNTLRVLAGTVEAAGLPKGVGVHTLRHSGASAMLAAGAPIVTVSRILGHSSIAITADIYGHVTTDDARKAVDHLSGFAGSTGNGS
jgi:integrase